MEYEILKPPPHRHRTAWILVAVLVAAALGGGAYVFGTHHGSTATAHHATSAPASAAHPLTVVATVPATGATDVPSNQVVTVTLSDPVAMVTAVPTFNPIVAGTWKKTATRTLMFAAAAPFLPTVTEILTIPAGLRATSGTTLGAPTRVTFAVAQASTERLQQLLAQESYLPLTFTPTNSTTPPADLVTAQPGTFAWRWPDLRWTSPHSGSRGPRTS